MKQNKKWIGTILLSSALLLGACGSDEINESTGTDTNQTTTEETSSESGDHGGMVHDESGEIPAGLEEAENPMYEVGESVILQHGHMPGMEGAEATIVGAFDTTAYEVSFDPTNGGEREENHRWVIHEELAESDEEAFEAELFDDAAEKFVDYKDYEEFGEFEDQLDSFNDDLFKKLMDGEL